MSAKTIRISRFVVVPISFLILVLSINQGLKDLPSNHKIKQELPNAVLESLGIVNKVAERLNRDFDDNLIINPLYRTSDNTVTFHPKSK